MCTEHITTDNGRSSKTRKSVKKGAGCGSCATIWVCREIKIADIHNCLHKYGIFLKGYRKASNNCYLWRGG